MLGSLVDTGYGDTVNKRFKRLQRELQLDDGAFKNELMKVVDR